MMSVGCSPVGGFEAAQDAFYEMAQSSSFVKVLNMDEMKPVMERLQRKRF